MTCQDSAPPPTIAVSGPRSACPRRGPLWPAGDIALARALFTVWAARTGRELRAVPVTDLTPAELIDFWADDQLDERPWRSLCGRLA